MSPVVEEMVECGEAKREISSISFVGFRVCFFHSLSTLTLRTFPTHFLPTNLILRACFLGIWPKKEAKGAASWLLCWGLDKGGRWGRECFSFSKSYSPGESGENLQNLEDTGGEGPGPVVSTPHIWRLLENSAGIGSGVGLSGLLLSD